MNPYLITMPGTAASIGAARAFVADHLNGHPRADEIALMVSEVATNAVRHTRSGRPDGTYQVMLSIGVGTVRVEVTDQGGETVPCQRSVSGDREGGRGVAIVDLLADRWGYNVERHAFWFELMTGETLAALS